MLPRDCQQQQLESGKTKYKYIRDDDLLYVSFTAEGKLNKARYWHYPCRPVVDSLLDANEIKQHYLASGVHPHGT